MSNLETELKNRVEETKRLVYTFNRENKRSIVRLVLIDESPSAAFQIHFRFKDKFVDSAIYDKGNAIIYPSEAVYEEIKRLAGNRKVNWNNTASIGWLAYEEGEK